MTDRVYFSKEEAEAEIGAEVRALAPFPSVPLETKGVVTKASHYAGDHYVVEVKWELPQPNELVDVTVANFLRKRKPVVDEFCKSEFAELVRVVQPAEQE